MGVQERVVRVRAERIFTKDVGDELVVYDPDSDRTHLLSASTRVVWERAAAGASAEQLCDAVVAAGLAEAAAAPAIVEVAIAELDDVGLLDTDSPAAAPHGLSRRQLLKRAGVAAIAVPTIITITAPPAAANHSSEPCRGLGNSCGTGTHDAACCSGTCQGGTCCLQPGTSGCSANSQCCAGICSDNRCCYVNGTTGGSASTCCGGGLTGAGACCVVTGSTSCTTKNDCCESNGDVLCENSRCCIKKNQAPPGGDASLCCSGSVTGGTCT